VGCVRIGVIGAGVAGLGAARLLKLGGHEVVVFEKSKGLGGRCATRRLNGFVFDTGATSIAPRGRALEPVMLQELVRSDLVTVASPIYMHQSLRISMGDSLKNSIARYCYGPGNNVLGKLLAQGLDVRLEQKVEAIEKHPQKGYRILGEEFEALILTAPIPQTRELLTSVGEFRPIANVTYRPCLSVLLGYKVPTPEVKYHALVDPDQRHPLTWLSVESLKSPGRAPEGCSAFVAQMSPDYSSSHFESTDESIIATTASYLERLYGKDFAVPEVADVKRWRFSQPEMTAMFDSVNRPNAKLLIASDGIVGGRVEYAYEAGYRAAQLLLKGNA
jgi:renalase